MVRSYQYQSSARTVRQRMAYRANVRAARKQHIRRSRRGLKSYWGGGKKRSFRVHSQGVDARASQKGLQRHP